MGHLTRAFAWSSTPLGPVASWPHSLRTTVSILLHAKFPMFLWWGADLIQLYNDAYRPSLGKAGKHPTALGQRGEDCWPEIWPTIAPLIAQVRAGGEATWHEDQLIPIYRNGRLEDVYWTFGYSPVRDESGGVGGVLVVCTETTAQVVAVANLRRSDQRFQNLVREALVGIVVLTGEQMRVRIVNEAYGRLIDRTPAQLLNRPLFDVVPEAEAAFGPLLEGVRRTGEPLYLYGQPYAVTGPNGARKTGFVDLIYQPYREADGTITGVMALCQDVTEHQVAEESVRRQNSQLLRLNNDLDSFIYTASHDLKMPITNIEGLVQALRDDLGPLGATGTVAHLLALMQDSVERFQRTIDQLSDVTRLQKEFAQPTTPVELAPVVDDVRQDLQWLLAQADAQLTLDLARCPRVLFSVKNLRSVVYNLLSNALKYHHPDRVPCVHLSCRKEAGFDVLAVQDNGLGLAPGHLAELFTMFRRFHSHVEGSGLGLYMVKRSVENAGGRVEVESTPEQGTTVSVFFPS